MNYLKTVLVIFILALLVVVLCESGTCDAATTDNPDGLLDLLWWVRYATFQPLDDWISSLFGGGDDVDWSTWLGPYW